MYDAGASYDENYERGPDPKFTNSKKFPKIKYNSAPKYNFLGVPLHIPFGVPAGPLLNSKFVNVAIDAGFCLPTYKTVRSMAWKSNNWPNVLRVKSADKSLYADYESSVYGERFLPNDYNDKNISITNSFGVPSKTPKIWSEDFSKLSNLSKETGFHVALSFQGSRHESLPNSHSGSVTSANAEKDFYKDIEKICHYCVETLSKSGFHLLEINLSCPNESLVPIYKDLNSTKKALQTVFETVQSLNKNIKIIAKTGVQTKEEANIFISECAPYLHAVSAINTVSAKIVDKNGQPALGSKSLTGGVCGNLIYDQGVRMVSLLAETRVKLGVDKSLSLIGVGGVANASQFAGYLNAGADIVQAATGMMWNLNLAQEIADSLGVSFSVLEK